MVAAQQFAEPLASFDLARRSADFGAGFAQLVAQPLMARRPSAH